MGAGLCNLKLIKDANKGEDGTFDSFADDTQMGGMADLLTVRARICKDLDSLELNLIK